MELMNFSWLSDILLDSPFLSFLQLIGVSLLMLVTTFLFYYVVAPIEYASSLVRKVSSVLGISWVVHRYVDSIDDFMSRINEPMENIDHY